jgi:hypothetical protein
MEQPLYLPSLIPDVDISKGAITVMVLRSSEYEFPTAGHSSLPFILIKQH